MKRSEINAAIQYAIDRCAEWNFHLPPFCAWTLEDWKSKGPECDEIRDNMLGWDVTDFGSNDFPKVGLTLVTIRNGNYNDERYKKAYCEKMLLMTPGQFLPTHFHWAKSEDIICRAGGPAKIQVYNATKDEDLDMETPVVLSIDGVVKTFEPGGIVVLNPGESVTLADHVYHNFQVDADAKPALLGEVSAVNDDANDNRFHKDLPRFAEIEEDEAPVRYLCNEYPKEG